MIDRAAERAKLIEVMATAMIKDMFAELELPVAGDLWQRYIGTAAAAFDALHGLVTVNTKEVLDFISDNDVEMQVFKARFRTVAAAGDLTNTPENKP
jgi:hypothetical protein